MAEKDKKHAPKIKNKTTMTHETKRNKLDNFENQKFADDIPLEDLKIEAEQEAHKHKTQDFSQSEQKYKND